MASNVLDEINKYKLRKVKASYTYKDTVQKALTNKAEQTKILLGMDTEATEEDIVAANMSNTYYYLLDRFKGNPRIPKAAPCKKGTSFWHRVARLCIQAKLDPVWYIRAQFVYFRDVFGKPPTFSQLVTPSALARAVEYQNSSKRKIKGHVAPVARPVDLPIEEKFKLADRRMRAVCKAQGMTRCEVYQNLVLPGFLLLPKEYISADPEYQKVVNG